MIMLPCGIWSYLEKITKTHPWPNHLWRRRRAGVGYKTKEVWFCVMSVGRPARHAKFTCTWSTEASHPPPFPTFQSNVMSPALKNPRFIMKLVIRWVLFCFESIHTVSHSPSLGDFRGTLWGWILGTLTDLSGLHKMGLVPQRTSLAFL